MRSADRWAIAAAVTMLLAFGGTPALATLVPSTFVGLQAGAGGPFGGQNQTFVDTQNGPTSGSVNASGAVNGQSASASAAAAADFGILGAAASASGVAAPAPGSQSGVDGHAEALAQWTDVLTPIPHVGSGLLPGAAASAELDLSIGLQNSLFAVNGAASFLYQLSVIRVDPTTLARTLLLSDCFTSNLADPNCFGSKVIGLPGNLGPPKVTLNLSPIILPVSILNPFGLEVSLATSVGGDTSGDPLILKSFTASADAFDPQQTFLNPIGDFSLVSGSGHDYSAPPPSSVPEPSSLLLLAAGLVALVVTCRRLKSGLRGTGFA